MSIPFFPIAIVSLFFLEIDTLPTIKSSYCFSQSILSLITTCKIYISCSSYFILYLLCILFLRIKKKKKTIWFVLSYKRNSLFDTIKRVPLRIYFLWKSSYLCLQSSPIPACFERQQNPLFCHKSPKNILYTHSCHYNCSFCFLIITFNV